MLMTSMRFWNSAPVRSAPAGSASFPAAGAQSSRRLKLARQHRQHRIMAQFVVLVEILIAMRNPEHPLAHQCRDLVLDQFQAPHVVKATMPTDPSF